jgi:hypothetical protein
VYDFFLVSTVGYFPFLRPELNFKTAGIPIPRDKMIQSKLRRSTDNLNVHERNEPGQPELKVVGMTNVTSSVGHSTYSVTTQRHQRCNPSSKSKNTSRQMSTMPFRGCNRSRFVFTVRGRCAIRWLVHPEAHCQRACLEKVCTSPRQLVTAHIPFLKHYYVSVLASSCTRAITYLM